MSGLIWVAIVVLILIGTWPDNGLTAAKPRPHHKVTMIIIRPVGA